jgi:chaperonin GroES
MLKPLGDNVVVTMIEVEEVTKSGILLATNSKEKSQLGEVIAIGNGNMSDGKKVEMLVKTGDKVVLNKYAGTEVECDDKKYYIVSQKDILAIVE